MDTKLNTALIKNYREIYIPETNKTIVPDKLYSAVILELANAGFRADDELLKAMATTDIDTLINIVEAIGIAIGKREYRPLFESFPNIDTEEKVMQTEILQEIHYSTMKFKKDFQYESVPDEDNHLNDLVVLHLMTKTRVIDTLSSILTMPTTFSEAQLEIFDALIPMVNVDDIIKLVSNGITVRDNKIVVLNRVSTLTNADKIISAALTTATDVLKFAANLNVEPGKPFVTIGRNKKFYFALNNKQQKLLLKIIDNLASHNMSDVVNDMFKYSVPFKSFIMATHPTSHKNAKKYPSAYKAFIRLMNNKKLPNWNSRFQYALDNRDKSEALSLAIQRPTDFARNLAFMLGIFDTQEVLKKFESVARQVPGRVLVDLYGAFNTPDYEHNRIPFVTNGFIAIEDSQHSYDYPDVLKIIKDALAYQAKYRSDISSEPFVHIDSGLYKLPVPIRERGLSSDIVTLPRLSRIPLESGMDIRTFIYWENGLYEHPSARIDLDSSIVAYKDGDSDALVEAWYHNFSDINLLRSSGDIVDASEGAVEFQDIKVQSLKDAGYKYVLTSVNSYTGQKFSDMKVAEAGFMYVSDKESQRDLNNVNKYVSSFNPKNVEHHYQLSNNSKNQTTMILDLENMEMIWVAAPLFSKTESFDRISNLINLKPMSIGELAELNAAAQGKVVLSSDKTSKMVELLGDEVAINLIKTYTLPTKTSPLHIPELLADLLTAE